MNDHKVILFVLAAIAYSLYSVHMWFVTQDVEVNAVVPENISKPDNTSKIEVQNDTQLHQLGTIPKPKPKVIPLYIKNACSVLEIFTEKTPKQYKIKREKLGTDNNTIAVIGITVFLIILLINAILEAIQANEDEKAKRKLNPDGERRQSLAEFANKKTLHRESSKFGLQLFQIAESIVNACDAKTEIPRRQVRPYNRGLSTNSYLSEAHRKPQEGSAPASISETPTGERKLIKRQSLAKLFGARPAPMVRRSSFPALPQNPEIQALMLGHRQQSVDSDDEGDNKGRRVRIIRRF